MFAAPRRQPCRRPQVKRVALCPLFTIQMNIDSIVCIRSQHRLLHVDGCLVALGGEQPAQGASGDSPAAANFDLAAGKWRNGSACIRDFRRSCGGFCVVEGGEGSRYATVVGGCGERDIAPEPLLVPLASLGPSVAKCLGREPPSLAWAGATMCAHRVPGGGTRGLVLGWDGIFQRADWVTAVALAR